MTATSRAAAAAARRYPLTITVHSPKGGVGKTLLACSLAAQYAAGGRRTLLLDLAMYGAVAPAFGLLQRETGLQALIAPLEQLPDQLSRPTLPELLRESMVSFPVGDHRLDLLLAAPPLKMAKFSLEGTERLLQTLCGEPYDIIVVDTSNEISERLAVALKMADMVLLVITPELAAAWALLSMRDLLRNLNPGGKLHLAINRSSRSLDVTELEAAVGYPVIAQIPEVAGPWGKVVGHELAHDYSRFGMALKHLAQRFSKIYSWLELPTVKG